MAATKSDGSAGELNRLPWRSFTTMAGPELIRMRRALERHITTARSSYLQDDLIAVADAVHGLEHALERAPLDAIAVACDEYLEGFRDVVTLARSMELRLPGWLLERQIVVAPSGTDLPTVLDVPRFPSWARLPAVQFPVSMRAVNIAGGGAVVGSAAWAGVASIWDAIPSSGGFIAFIVLLVIVYPVISARDGKITREMTPSLDAAHHAATLWPTELSPVGLTKPTPGGSPASTAGQSLSPETIAEARASFADLEQAWLDYTLDTEACFLTKPLLRSVEEPETRAYQDAWFTAKELIDTDLGSEHDNAYAQKLTAAVELAWERWDTANRHAREIGLDPFTTAERVALRRTRKLVDRIADPAVLPGERDRYISELSNQLAKLTSVPSMRANTSGLPQIAAASPLTALNVAGHLRGRATPSLSNQADIRLLAGDHTELNENDDRRGA